MTRLLLLVCLLFPVAACAQDTMTVEVEPDSVLVLKIKGKKPACRPNCAPPDTTTPPDTVTPPPPDTVVPPPVVDSVRMCATDCLYVAPTGNDANHGTASAPYRTLQKAASVTAPGDSVMVKPGTYTGGSTVVSVTRSGTASAWVTFVCVTDRACVIDGRNNASVEGWNLRASYIEVAGFDVSGLQGYGFVHYASGTHHHRVLDNAIHHIGRYCTTTSNGRTASSLGAGVRNVVYRGNAIHDIGRYAHGENGCDTGGNTYYMNHDHGIYVADADSVTIEANDFGPHTRGWAVQRYKSGGYNTKAMRIVGNTFTGANPYRDGQIIIATSTTGAVIADNVSANPRKAFVLIDGGTHSGGVIQGNATTGGVTVTGSKTGWTVTGNVER